MIPQMPCRSAGPKWLAGDVTVLKIALLLKRYKRPNSGVQGWGSAVKNFTAQAL
jgi:hypothetical protein